MKVRINKDRIFESISFLEATNFEKISQITISLLMEDVTEVDKWGMILNHPLLKGLLYTDETAFNKMRSNWAENIKQECDISSYDFVVQKPCKLGWFHLIYRYLCRDDFSKLLKQIWIESESPMQSEITVDEYVKWFISADRTIMIDEAENEDGITFNSLPNEITIYRGVTENKTHNYNGISWTVDYDTAVHFAQRYIHVGDGVILEANIKKENILAFFTTRGESEVIIDYRNVKWRIAQRFDKE